MVFLEALAVVCSHVEVVCLFQDVCELWLEDVAGLQELFEELLSDFVENVFLGGFLCLAEVFWRSLGAEGEAVLL